MVKTERLKMELFSRRELTPQAAEKQLLWLADFGDGRFEPERCDVYEPLKERFSRESLASPIRWLSQPGGEFKFKREQSVKLSGFIRNRKFRSIVRRVGGNSSPQALVPKVSEPVFVSSWCVWVGPGEDVDWILLRRFLIEASRIAGADFGYLTTEGDQKSKNFRVRAEEWGTVEGFVGDDPEKGLPGLYWANVFGRLYTDWFGPDRLRGVSATVAEPLGDQGFFLQFGADPGDSRSERVGELQRAARRLLGEDAFFNLARPDLSVRVPPFQRGS